MRMNGGAKAPLAPENMFIYIHIYICGIWYSAR